MTPREMFAAAYRRAAVAVGAEIDPAHVAECWTQADGFAAALYDAAATRLLSTAKFLPRPAEWREALRDLSLEQEQDARRDREAMLAGDERLYHCPVCQDTGWEPKVCTDRDWCGTCRRHKVHLYDHDYWTECLCRGSNEAYQVKIDKQRAMVTRGKAA